MLQIQDIAGIWNLPASYLINLYCLYWSFEILHKFREEQKLNDRKLVPAGVKVYNNSCSHGSQIAWAPAVLFSSAFRLWVQEK